jgi:hypothetical protein
MPVRQASHQLGQHFQTDEEAVQRVFVQLVGAGEGIVEQRILKALASSFLSLK